MNSFDVVIMGGGITGLGIAHTLATQGYSVCILEKATLGDGTSAHSHRIIHRGFRYLASLDIPRVMSSISSYRWIKNFEPHAVSPLQCLMPLKRFGLKSWVPSLCGCLLYRGMTLSDDLPFPTVISSNFKGVINTESAYLLSWYDGFLADHGLLIKALSDRTEAAGGVCIEHACVDEVSEIRCNSPAVHKINYSTQGREHSVEGKVIVDSRGASVRASLFPSYALSRAFNVVFPEFLPENKGYAMFSPKGRLYFLVPRPDGCALGTGYLPFHQGGDASVSEEEVSSFLKEAEGLFRAQVSRVENVSRIETGIIPLKSLSESEPRFFGSSLIRNDGNRIDILATKYTSFPETASKVKSLVDSLLRNTNA